MKRSALVEELGLWMRGRFSMTHEEKIWMLLILVIIWVGLLGRYAYLKNKAPTTLTPQQTQDLALPEVSPG